MNVGGKQIEVLEIGDIQIEDGEEWYISGVTFREGKPSYSRVRVGSDAHSFLIQRDNPSIKVNTDGTDGEDSVKSSDTIRAKS